MKYFHKVYNGLTIANPVLDYTDLLYSKNIDWIAHYKKFFEKVGLKDRYYIERAYKSLNYQIITTYLKLIISDLVKDMIVRIHRNRLILFVTRDKKGGRRSRAIVYIKTRKSHYIKFTSSLAKEIHYNELRGYEYNRKINDTF